MYVDWNTIVFAGAVLSALALIIGIFAKAHKWLLKQNKQSEDIAELKKHHDQDIKGIKEETRLICFGLSACLDGLIQQGCNHTVPEAKQMLDEYLNKLAHE